MCSPWYRLGLVVALCGCHVSSRWQAPPSGSLPDASEAPAPTTTPNLDAGLDAAVEFDAAGDASSDEDDPNALPTNVSFETARPVELGSTTVWQTLHNAEQVDYYSFQGEAGRFYELHTNHGAFTPENVITLYDADRKVIAENDNGSLWPGDAIDARLVVRLPHTGTYYLVVEDRTSPPEYFNSAFAAIFYQIVIQAIDQNTPGFVFENASDLEPAPVRFLNDARTGNAYATLVGLLSEGDRDVFSFSGQDERALIGELLAPGGAGDSSTALLGRVRVANAEQHAVGYIDRALGQHNFHPPVAHGDYQLTVSADGQPGSNGFYVVNMTLLADNPREQYNDSNTTLAMAEPLMWRGSVTRRSLFLARVPPGDIDYYSMEVAEDEQISLVCEGESGGSGVHALRAEVRDELDKVLVFAVEEPVDNLVIEKVPMKAPGKRYLRLSSEKSQLTEMIDPWVRCLVTINLDL